MSLSTNLHQTGSRANSLLKFKGQHASTAIVTAVYRRKIFNLLGKIQKKYANKDVPRHQLLEKISGITLLMSQTWYSRQSNMKDGIVIDSHQIFRSLTVLSAKRVYLRNNTVLINTTLST